MPHPPVKWPTDRKSTRLNSSHLVISYAVFCLKKTIPSTSRPCYPAVPLLSTSWAVPGSGVDGILLRGRPRDEQGQHADVAASDCFFLMIRRPPRSTLFPLHDALPI